MRLALDPGSTVAPYEQVRAEIARQISENVLAVGAKLPTVRGLAAELGLAPNTVARSYRELEEAGLIETRGRAGSFVSAAGDPHRQRMREAAESYADLARGLGVSDAEALRIVAAAVRGE